MSFKAINKQPSIIAGNAALPLGEATVIKGNTEENNPFDALLSHAPVP